MKTKEDDLYDSVYQLEVDLAKLAQYGRRETLQIRGIPNSIKQGDLEKYCINMLDKIGVKVCPADVVACHRLYQRDKSKPADTVIRFVNRKNVFRARKNQFKLRDVGFTNLRFLDNLCPYYRKLLNECSKYKSKGKINSYWTYNGKVFVKKHEDDPRGQPLFHIDELDGFIDDSVINDDSVEKNNIKVVNI